MGSLVIPVQHLDTHGKDFVFALDQAWLDGAFGGTGVRGDASNGDGAVSVHAQRNGGEILVHGKANACLVAECGRCLRDVALQVTCDLAALYTPGHPPARASQQQDEESDDVDPDAPDREFYSGEEVVINDLVRDYLLLELPMQPRCEEGTAECRIPNTSVGAVEAASQSSGGERIDPRLIPLMKLAKGEPEKE
jgi:uncharacterized protein